MKKTSIPVLISAITVFLTAQANVSAQLITPNNAATPVVTNTVDPAGYYLFDTYPNVVGHPAAADINSLPTYATLTEEAPIFPPEGLSPDLTVDGTTYRGDGVDFATAGTPSTVPITGLVIPGTGTPVEFATFALGSGTPTAFTVGLLSNYPDATYYRLSLYSGDPNANTLTPIATAVLDPAQTSNPGVNEFYYADVTGAADGDYLVVDGYSSVNHSSQVTLGGVTFDPVLTPEPSACMLMLSGLGLLGLVAHLRRRHA